MSQELPPDEAWDSTLNSLFDEEAARLKNLSDDELDRDLAAKGFDPQALTAQSRALMARLEATHKPAPAAQRPATQQGKVARPWPSRPSVWLPPVALAAGVALYIARKPTPEVAQQPPTPPAAVSTPPLEPTAQSTPQELANTRRKEALAACDAKDWDECEYKLSQALDLDPKGNDAPSVQALRKRLNEGIAHDPRFRAK